MAEVDTRTEEQKERKRAYHAAWYQRNKEKKDAQNYAWRVKNPNRPKEIVAKSYMKHRKKRCQEQSDRRAANRELENFRMREWRSSNKDRHQAYKRELAQLYRAKRGIKIGWFNADDLAKILDRQGFKCVYCPSDVRDDFHFDHRVAFSIVGGGNPENIQCLCADCNFRKGKKSHDEFAAIKTMEMQQNG